EVYGFTCFESRLSHPDGLVRFFKGPDDMSGYIVGISKPSNKEPGIEVTKGLFRMLSFQIVFLKCILRLSNVSFLVVISLSQALKIVLCKVVAQPDFVDAWVRLLLFSRCTLRVYRPKNRQERRSENKKSLQQIFILRSLATWGKDDGMIMLVKSILNGFALGSIGYGGVKVLSSSGVALYYDYTIKALEAKHPYKSPPSMPSITFSKPPVIAEIDSVFGCIKSFPKGTSCGRDGLRAHHILDALCGEGYATATYLLKALYGDVFVSKVSMKGVGKEMSKSLAMLTVDLSNAFILVDRSTLLHEVRQGDLLGPLVFALILHSLPHKIKDSCKLLLHAWYLDDRTVIGDSKEFASVLGIIKACLDSFRKHVVHCKELPGFKYRHDMVRDVLFDISGQAALKAASCKVTKDEKACIENQQVVIPFAFDTFGFLAPEVVDLLRRVQRVMHNNVMTPRFTDVVFIRIAFTIQKGLAKPLVACFSSTTM
nr:hypothetical protein [Tanacetum cinerariifolium]GEY99059.1 hypothetical protein [Tanacetum cinerariifolium]